MKRKQISPDENTNWSILKGLSARENCEEFLKVLLKTDKLPFNEKDFLNIIFNLGRNGNQIYLLEVCKIKCYICCCAFNINNLFYSHSFLRNSTWMNVPQICINTWIIFV